MIKRNEIIQFDTTCAMFAKLLSLYTVSFLHNTSLYFRTNVDNKFPLTDIRIPIKSIYKVRWS